MGKTNDTESLKALELLSPQASISSIPPMYTGMATANSCWRKRPKARKTTYISPRSFAAEGDIHDAATYSEHQVREYCEDSLRNLQREAIDLYQIHCPPKYILEDGAVFEVLDKLKAEGKIRAYGVSVESVEEGSICLGTSQVFKRCKSSSTCSGKSRYTDIPEGTCARRRHPRRGCRSQAVY